LDSRGLLAYDSQFGKRSKRLAHAVAARASRAARAAAFFGGLPSKKASVVASPPTSSNQSHLGGIAVAIPNLMMLGTPGRSFVNASDGVENFFGPPVLSKMMAAAWDTQALAKSPACRE